MAGGTHDGCNKECKDCDVCRHRKNCDVCATEKVPSGLMVTLPCNHALCVGCLCRLQHDIIKCPMCRTTVSAEVVYCRAEEDTLFVREMIETGAASRPFAWRDISRRATLADLAYTMVKYHPTAPVGAEPAIVADGERAIDLLRDAGVKPTLAPLSYERRSSAYVPLTIRSQWFAHYLSHDESALHRAARMRKAVRHATEFYSLEEMLNADAVRALLAGGMQWDNYGGLLRLIQHSAPRLTPREMADLALAVFFMPEMGRWKTGVKSAFVEDLLPLCEGALNQASFAASLLVAGSRGRGLCNIFRNAGAFEGLDHAEQIACEDWLSLARSPQAKTTIGTGQCLWAAELAVRFNHVAYIKTIIEGMYPCNVMRFLMYERLVPSHGSSLRDIGMAMLAVASWLFVEEPAARRALGNRLWFRNWFERQIASIRCAARFGPEVTETQLFKDYRRVVELATPQVRHDLFKLEGSFQHSPAPKTAPDAIKLVGKRNLQRDVFPVQDCHKEMHKVAINILKRQGLVRWKKRETRPAEDAGATAAGAAAGGGGGEGKRICLDGQVVDLADGLLTATELAAVAAVEEVEEDA